MRTTDFVTNRAGSNGPGGVRCRCCRHVTGGTRTNRRYTNRRARRANHIVEHDYVRRYNA